MPTPGIYAFAPAGGGVHHYRIKEPLRVAGDLGIRTGYGRMLSQQICEQYDTLLVHMFHYEAYVEDLARLVNIGHHRLVLDIDDAMWCPDFVPFKQNFDTDALMRLYRVAGMAHVITTPSEVIAEHLSKMNPNVHVVPNTVPGYLLFQTMRRRPKGTYAVGWQGGISHIDDLGHNFMSAMRDFLRDTPDWKWRVYGGADDWFGDVLDFEFSEDEQQSYVKRLPWQPDMRSYYRSLSMDIGVGPLKRSPFNDGKSSLRAVEYAALGIPAVLSDSPAYRGWVDNGVTGYLVDDPDGWYEILTNLADHPELRSEMSHNARKKALDWTTENNIMKWVGAWNSV